MPYQFNPFTGNLDAVPAGTGVDFYGIWLSGALGLLNPGNAAAASTLTGTGAYLALASIEWAISTGTAGTSFVGFPSIPILSGDVDSFKAISFEKPLGFSFETMNIYFPAPAGRIMMGVGKKAQTVGDISDLGIYFLLEQGVDDHHQTVKLQVHDGTTLTTTAVLATIENFNNEHRYIFTARSDGNGNVNAYINGALIGATAAGPKLISSGGNQRLSFEVDTNGDVSATGVNLAMGRIWTFVQR